MGWQQDGGVTLGGRGGLLSEDLFACFTAGATGNISDQFLEFPSPRLQEIEFETDQVSPPGSFDEEAPTTGACPTKKLCHNAYERDRRKKLNDLYSSLRTLLPDSDRNKKRKKKLSIPVTISLVLKYIPELQRRVERLLRRKEEIGSEPARAAGGCGSHCAVSATCLGDREVMVQLCLLNKDSLASLSRVLKVLEKEGLHLMSISTCASRDDRFFCSIHLRGGYQALKKENFCEHLMGEIKEQARADDSNIVSTVPTMFMH